MTPKEKADSLIEKFRFQTLRRDVPFLHESIAIEFTLICVNEIIWVLNSKKEISGIVHYWEQVKEEIEKLLL